MRVSGSFLVRFAPSGHPSTGQGRRAWTSRRRRGWVPAVALTVLPLAAIAAHAQERVALEVGTVLATNASTHIDSQLASVRGQLQRLFQYTSYRLVKQETNEVSCGKPASFEIPGGRHLEVTAKDTRGGRVALNVALMKGRHELLRTDLTLGKRGTIMVGGPRYENGVLIIWIGAKRMSPGGATGAGTTAVASPSP